MHTQCDSIQQYTHKWYINYCVGIFMLAVCFSEGHLRMLISPARVESLMLRKASTRVAQVTGCLPLPVSHSLSISVFICTGLFEHLCAIILTLDPFLSSRRKMPKRTYLAAISIGMLTTLPSVHVNFSSSGRVGLVPGMYVVCEEVGKIVCLSNTIRTWQQCREMTHWVATRMSLTQFSLSYSHCWETLACARSWGAPPTCLCCWVMVVWGVAAERVFFYISYLLFFKGEGGQVGFHKNLFGKVTVVGLIWWVWQYLMQLCHHIFSSLLVYGWVGWGALWNAVKLDIV